MKTKLLFGIVMLFIAITVNSQIYMLKSYSSFYKKTNEPVKDVDTELLISINLTDNIIKIDNKFEDVFFLRHYISTEEDLKDKDGDIYSTLYYSAYDNTGKECTVSISVWEDYNLINVGLLYNNMIYGYNCKIIN